MPEIIELDSIRAEIINRHNIIDWPGVFPRCTGAPIPLPIMRDST